MALATSETWFLTRGKSLGVPESALTKLKDLHIATAAKLAFTTGHIPGQGSEQAFVEDILKPVLGEAGATDRAQ
eukprot:6473961-Amphidinium_carterae.1